MTEAIKAYKRLSTLLSTNSTTTTTTITTPSVSSSVSSFSIDDLKKNRPILNGLFDSTLISISRSLEDPDLEVMEEDDPNNQMKSLFTSRMFNNLYELYELSKSIKKTELDEEDESSDDSFAASFSQCIQKLNVYASRDIRALFKQNSRCRGGLFRIILLQDNMEKERIYAFLILISDCFNQNEKNKVIDLIRDDEVYLWWW